MGGLLLLSPGVPGSRAEQGPGLESPAAPFSWPWHLSVHIAVHGLTMRQALSNLILTVQLCDMLILVIVLGEVKGV